MNERIRNALLKSRENIDRVKNSPSSVRIDDSFEMPSHHLKISQFSPLKVAGQFSSESIKGILPTNMNVITTIEIGNYIDSKKHPYENLSKEEIASLVADVKKQYLSKAVGRERTELTLGTSTNKKEDSIFKSEEIDLVHTYPIKLLIEAKTNQKDFGNHLDGLKRDMQTFFSRN